MAIAWTPDQRRRVEALLARHQFDTGRCETAARGILPVGRERDPNAQIWRLEPTEGRYVVPRVKLDFPWYYHFTVETEAHFVDALTGVDGTLRASYLDEYWTEAAAIAWVEEGAQ
jgi:hypothetical protein